MARDAYAGRLFQDLQLQRECNPRNSRAQVHKAVLTVGGRTRPVAVKVRHPGVELSIVQDFQLLIPLARATSKFKALKVGACWACRQRCLVW